MTVIGGKNKGIPQDLFTNTASTRDPLGKFFENLLSCNLLTYLLPYVANVWYVGRAVPYSVPRE